MSKLNRPDCNLWPREYSPGAICCWRPLSVTKLKVAVQPEFQGFVRLEHTIVQICGHFISVDNSSISLVHATARSFPALH
jgi:hypothetical protein